MSIVKSSFISIGVTIIVKLLSFAFSVKVVNSSPSAEYGLAYFTLNNIDLYSLFYTKEAFRKVNLSLSENNSSEGSFLTRVIIIFVSILFYFWKKDLDIFVLVIFTLGVWVEGVLVEPFVIKALKGPNPEIKNIGYSTSLLIKSIFIYILFIWLSLPLLYAYAISHLISSTVFYYIISRGVSTQKHEKEEKYNIIFNLKINWIILASKKFLTTHIDGLLLSTSLSSHIDEYTGIYAFISNLGSLVLRLLFQPIEELCFSISKKEKGGFDFLFYLVLTIGIYCAVFTNIGSIVDFIFLFLFPLKFITCFKYFKLFTLYILSCGISGVTEAEFHRQVNSGSHPFRVIYKSQIMSIFVNISVYFILLNVYEINVLNCVIWGNIGNMITRFLCSIWYLNFSPLPSFKYTFIWVCVISSLIGMKGEYNYYTLIIEILIILSSLFLFLWSTPEFKLLREYISSTKKLN